MTGYRYEPASADQERVLLIRETLRERGREWPGSVLTVGMRFPDLLDPATARQVMDELTGKHPALRVSFDRNPTLSGEGRERRLAAFQRTATFTPGLYLKKVAAHVSVPMRFLNIDAISEEQQDRELALLLEAEHLAGFDPGVAPLLRGLVVELPDGSSLLILCLDHLICDRVSLDVLYSDVTAIYATGGEWPPLATAPVEPSATGGVIEGGADVSAHLRYWRDVWAVHCAHRIAIGDIPFRLDPTGNTNEFAVNTMKLEAWEASELRALSASHKTSPHVIVLTAYALVLGLYTGLQNVALWTHFANRMAPLSWNEVGWRAHTHLVGIDVSRSRPVSDVLHDVRRQMLTSFEHQELSVTILWNAIGCHPRFTDAMPLVDYYGAMRRDGAVRPDVVRRIPLPEVAAARVSSLGLYLDETNRAARLTCRYLSNVYHKDGVVNLITDVRSVIAVLSSEPVTPVGNLTQVSGRYDVAVRPNTEAMREIILADCRDLSRIDFDPLCR